MSSIKYTAITRGVASGTRSRVTSTTSTAFTHQSSASMFSAAPLPTSSSMTTVSKADSDDVSGSLKEHSAHLQDVIAAYRHIQKAEAIRAKKLFNQYKKRERFAVVRAAQREFAKMLRAAGHPIIPMVVISSAEEEEITAWEDSFIADASAREYIGQFLDPAGPPAIPSPELLSPRRAPRSVQVTEPQYEEDEEEERDSCLDFLFQPLSGNNHTTHASEADDTLDLNDLLVDHESLLSLKPSTELFENAGPNGTSSSSLQADDTLDIEDLMAGYDTASLFAVTMPKEVAKEDNSWPDNAPKLEAAKKSRRRRTEHVSKKPKRTHRKEVAKTEAFYDGFSARLDAVDDGFKEVGRKFDAVGNQIQTVCEEAERAFGISA